MGGVDLMEKLLSSYRSKLQSKKWYWNLFINAVNVSVLASWRIYQNRDNMKESHFSFRFALAVYFVKSASSMTNSILSGPGSNPLQEIRFDGLNHYLISQAKQARCAGGFYAALPHIIMTFVVLFGGWASDKLRKKGVISTTNVRKLFNCGGFGLEALFLLVVAYSESSSSTIIYLTFAVGFSGFAISGYNVNHLDIAPVYASIIMGISNAFGTISGILCPIITEEMTKNGSHEWKNVFIMAACIHIFGVIFYGINASGEIQHWAKSKKNIPDDLYVGYNSL
ncbi:hypothetical protein A3Q56_05708 [Intoshia linei]|uniref:Major facilitator superfamily (MFS) profile domain-containing protein n=1 Tax=Intoshia linei TaxID=1819745 RepID=A0A177AX56_9BILA|nr:hypothetical protein A3Q56_05708 [Intoshia linei]